MPRPLILSLIILGALLSVFFWLRLLKRDLHWVEKVGGTILLAVPIIGPLLYLLVLSDPAPQHPMLQNPGGRGDYAQRVIMMKAALEKIEAEQSAMQDPNQRDGEPRS
jgi:hypothetical protein